MYSLVRTFADVLAPVFLLVLLGYVVSSRLHLESRTLSRFSYYVLTPAFVFHVMSTARIDADLAARMTGYIVVVHSLCALLGFVVARLLRRSAPMTAAYVMIAVFGNVGNFGLPIVQFRYPNEPYVLAIATVYFLAILIIAFAICVAAANWGRGGRMRAILAVARTPALLAVPPALVANLLTLKTGVAVPPMLARPVELLAAAMIPVMVVSLGCQLAHEGIPRPSFDMVAANSVRLIGGPVLALALAVPFGITGIERHVGVLQASMPAAVLVSIIASEHDILPAFVTTSVLLSTLLSSLTLALVLTLATGG